MSTSNRWLIRAQKIVTLNNRELFSTLISPGFYIITTLGSFASSMILVNSLNYIQENGVVVFDNPLAFSVQVFVLIFSLYLGFIAATSITREREAGTLETLFYGPVDEFSVVIAKLLTLTISFVIAAVFFSVILALFSFVTNFHLPANFASILIFSMVIASNLIAAGLFISSAVKTTRVASLFFLGVIAVILAIQFGYSYVFSLAPARYYDSFSLLKQLLAYLNQVLDFVSPFSFFTKGMDAITNGRLSEFFWILSRSFLLTIILSILSIRNLIRRGVRR